MANCYRNGVFHGSIGIVDFQDPWPCSWDDDVTVFVCHERSWWRASPRTVVMNDRKGHPVVYWDKVHPDLVPKELRIYELILN